jgi:hypothetical protein
MVPRWFRRSSGRSRPCPCPGPTIISSARAARRASGVPHRRRRVAVDRAEVALPVGEQVPHVEVLGHADERVVDRRVAVRMEVAHHLADDLGALAIAAIRREPHRLHAVEHAAVRRLQSVPDVRQRTSHDHAHGVIHVRALHLVFDVDGDAVRRRRRGHRCLGGSVWACDYTSSCGVERVVLDELARGST